MLLSKLYWVGSTHIISFIRVVFGGATGVLFYFIRRTWIAALVPKCEVDGELGDAHMAMRARLMSQVRSKLATFGSCAPSEVTCGGNALKFYSSIRLNIRRIGLVKKGEEVLLVCFRLTQRKRKWVLCSCWRNYSNPSSRRLWQDSENRTLLSNLLIKNSSQRPKIVTIEDNLMVVGCKGRILARQLARHIRLDYATGGLSSPFSEPRLIENHCYDFRF
ncbi:unnamed protein product [Lactuca saligna]|uniref:RecA family profile 2 domain-containing protein n=1 Tax=Lactuca saligna TaxID=75948 RepID=A0AA35Z231_LACSI|nr:unnamed protein product [Lactuca saligna]